MLAPFSWDPEAHGFVEGIELFCSLSYLCQDPLLGRGVSRPVAGVLKVSPENCMAGSCLYVAGLRFPKLSVFKTHGEGSGLPGKRIRSKGWLRILKVWLTGS